MSGAEDEKVASHESSQPPEFGLPLEGRMSVKRPTGTEAEGMLPPKYDVASEDKNLADLPLV